MIRLLISDRDREYGAALGRAISHLHKEIEVTVAEPGCGAEEFAFSFDWVLSGDEEQLIWVKEWLEEEDGHLLQILMAEFPVASLEEQKEGKKGDDPFLLYKYRPVSETVSALYFLHHLSKGMCIAERSHGEAQTIAFYSPMGGAGTTSLALSTGRELCQFHRKRVLYLNFADFFHPSFYFGRHAGNGGLSDYLYYTLEKQDPGITRSFDLFCCIDDYGLRTFSLSKGRNELGDLSIEAMGVFLDHLICDSGFDYVILDLPKNLSAKTLYLLERSTKFILIFNGLPPAQVYQNQLVAHLEQSGISCQKKMITVQNKTNFDHLQEKQTTWADIEIEEDMQSFLWTEDGVSISMNHLFGLGVKKIGEEVLNNRK